MKKQMDEMDRNIRLRSQEYGFKFVVLLLSAWVLYESFLALSQGTKLHIVPSLVLTATMMVQGLSELWMKQRMTAGDEEYKAPNMLLRTVILTLAVTGIVLSLGTYFLMKSGR